jgi:DNA-binding transcriptional LysR family regulator
MAKLSNCRNIGQLEARAGPCREIGVVDRLTSMTVFVRVASARSFSAAARELGISQATASKHVQMLEGWLGARLLQRTTRRVALTDAGASFFSQSTHILEDMEAARQTGRAGENLRGNLRLAAPVGFGMVRLAPLLAGFMTENPDLLLTVTLCDRPVDVIEEGYDLAIRFGAGPCNDTRLTLHRFRPLRFVVCAAPSYLAAHGRPEVPADLEQHVCLIDSRHPGDIWRFSGPDGDTEVTVSGQLRADCGMLRRGAACTGAGVLLAPEFLVEADIASGALVQLLPDYRPPSWGLDAVCAANRGAAQKVHSFIAFLTARLGE